MYVDSFKHTHARHLAFTTHRDPLLLTDLASDVGTGPEVDGEDKVCQATQETTVTNCLSILPNDVAWAEVGDDACQETDSVISRL